MIPVRDPGLAEREAIYRQATAIAGVGAFTWDLTEGRCLWCSEQLARIFDGSVERYMAERATDPEVVAAIHPDDRPAYARVIDRVIREGGSYEVRYRSFTMTGGLVHVVEAAETVADATTGHILMVGCVVDETHHKQVEARLRETNDTLERKVEERTAALSAALARAEATEAKFLAAAEALRDGLAIYDGDDRLAYFNPRYHEFLPDVSKAVLRIGATFTDILREAAMNGPVYHADMGRDFVGTRLERHAAAAGTTLVRYADGRWVQVQESRMADGGRVVVTTDVTAERAAAAELRRSERRFRELVEAHPMPLAVLRRADGKVLFASASFLDALGTTPDRLRDGEVDRFVADPRARALLDRQLRQDGRIDAVEITLARADGTVFPVLLRCHATMLGGQDVVLSSFIDLTTQKRLEAEMERQRDALHQSEKLTAMGSLLAGVAHELNNPLSVVIGQADMLLETVTDPQLLKRAERIQRSADRCARIVRTFLAIARQRGRDRRPVPIAQAVAGAAGIAAYGFRADGIELVRRLPPDLPDIVADEDQLDQVLANLLVNAQQALRDREGPRRVEIAAGVRGGRVTIRVEDNGPGIPEADRARIFEPFFTTKPVGVGTGLGLALCHAIVTEHGGRIALVEGGLGGACFEIDLPAAPAGVEPDGAAPDRQDAAPRARILVVDDEPEIVELLDEVLGRDGHRVLVASNGAAALDLLLSQPVDLVLSDLRMPGMDGQRLRELAMARGVRAPFLFMTGDTLSPTRGQGAPPLPLVEKPLRPAELRALVAAELSAGRTG